jgi:hypothetical protein
VISVTSFTPSTAYAIGTVMAVTQNEAGLTALTDPIAYIPINSYSDTGTTAQINALYQNTALSVSTYTCEIGLLASNSTLGEILYAYANAGTNGDTIPPYSDGPFSRQFQISTSIGSATNITATMPSNAYILASAEGVANGVATLDSTANVPLSQLGNIRPAGTSSLGTVELPPSAGTPATPVVPYAAARVQEQLITVTSQTTVLSYTPVAQGNFTIKVYLRVVTAATSVAITVTYTDATGSQTMPLVNASVPVGSYDVTAFTNATTGSPIAVNVTAGTSSQVYVSAIIEGV